MKNINITTQNKAFEEISEKLEDIIKTNMVWDNEISLNGAAGTGKTYLTTKLVKKLKSSYHITITAPTHKALQVLRDNLLADDIYRVDTKTLQSFLNLKLETNFDNGEQKFVPQNLNVKDKDTTDTDILIVDESSMVSKSLYTYIIQAIEQGRIKAVLFVGDEYQLLPIDDNDNRIFSIKNKYKLEKIVRQAKGSYIINMATKARNIIKSKQYISLQDFFDDDSFKSNIHFFGDEKEFHNDFCTPENWSKKDKVIASFTNKSVDNHNRIIRKKFWKAQEKKDIPTLLKGDKIIFQQANIIDGKIVHQNSDIVTLSSAIKLYDKTLQTDYWDCKDLQNKPIKIIDPTSQARFKIVLQKLAKSAKDEKNYKKRTELWKLFYTIKETFIDVKYTYASTMHKLQGSTYETVYIDLRDVENMKDKDMMYRLLYVAITRASKNVKVLLSSNMDSSLATIQERNIEYIGSMFDKLELDI
ncbi:MAG: tRNA (adenosine(37)-N6)-threonylcarbamoyltransferase complex ATPase subunit type 1 TsaE [Campylobacterota bacterium]|nr:tRNA (adenosine(37)-N6)-threonylcarbamoyltransferase complex ATPase subunit type 1 TsaE [Campylobacterota bacterium]